MKTFAYSSCITLITSLILFLSGCGSGKPELVKVDPAFNEYISAYSSGMRSRKNHIRVELQDVLAEDVLATIRNNEFGTPDATILKDIFTFEPEIKGHAVWTDEHSIEFIPDEALPVNQFYNVYFDLEKLVQVKDGYEEFHFQFATYEQKLKVKFFIAVFHLYQFFQIKINIVELIYGQCFIGDKFDRMLICPDCMAFDFRFKRKDVFQNCCIRCTKFIVPDCSQYIFSQHILQFHTNVVFTRTHSGRISRDVFIKSRIDFHQFRFPRAATAEEKDKRSNECNARGVSKRFHSFRIND